MTTYDPLDYERTPAEYAAMTPRERRLWALRFSMHHTVHFLIAMASLKPGKAAAHAFAAEMWGLAAAYNLVVDRLTRRAVEP